MTRTNILPFALAAAARGWRVFPLRPRAKRPLPGFTDWERHSTTDPGRIRDHWGAHPRDNYGIATGPSGLVVVDLDTPKQGEQPPPEWAKPGITNGADVFADLWEQHGQGELSLDTFTVRTRRGGLHLYYAAPEGRRFRNTSEKLGWKIDTRACGGYVVGPGCHVADDDGTGDYTVQNTAAPAPFPTWLAGLLPRADPRPVTSGQVHTMLATHHNAAGYATAALRGEVERVLAARPGGRNHTLNIAAFALGQLVGGGLLPKHLTEDALLQAGLAVGLTEAECEATIRSGIQSGLREPRGGAA
ncbi:bifunctional DNA primase/polymerase [Nocardiopsis rhodophaea]|uniref:Bifunctional DNA primase/polymerase n=1 Tax=Nocardiopsis rhodophaea TaxID=280238 RepID=A0ABN2TMU1_9ACTN